MAQDFKMRYPLVDGHGNFGSTDNDPPAAMRYTESRLSRYGELMLDGIQKNAVKMVPNFDESETEPEVLSGLFPSLLLNGVEGIAVGMTANFLPHSAKDVYEAIDLILKDAINGEETPEDKIIDIIQAPDFPTGGVITNLPEVHEAYRKGYGHCVVRAKYHFEDYGKDKTAIIITELPYNVIKSKLVMKIATLAKESEDFSMIHDVRDESDRSGIRVVIELKKDALTNIMVNRLLKATDMQVSLPIHHNALVDGHPQLDIPLKHLLEAFILHATSVCRNEVKFDYDKLMKRYHIVEAYIKALEDVDKTIELVKAKSREEAEKNLVEAYGFDEEQTKAVVAMHFYSLNSEDKEKLEDENEELKKNIAYHKAILDDEMELLKYTRSRIKEVADKYFSKDKRLTDISTEMDGRDTIPDIDVVVAYTHNSYIKSVKLDEYRNQGRAGKGTLFKTKEGDFVESVHTLSTHDDLVAITSAGKAYVLPAYKIPTVSKSSVGKPLNNYMTLPDDEKVVKFIVLAEKDKESTDQTILLTTKKGIAKRITFNQLPRQRTGAKIIGFKLEGDELVGASIVKKDSTAVLISYEGIMNSFPVDLLPVMGRTASGVAAMKLNKGDEIVAAFSVEEDEEVLQVMESGSAKRMPYEELSVRKNRGGKGVKCLTAPGKVGKVVAAGPVKPEDECMVITQNGNLLRTSASEISLQSRISNGVKLIKMNSDDKIASVTVIETEDETSDE